VTGVVQREERPIRHRIVELLTAGRPPLGELPFVPVHRHEPAPWWQRRRGLRQRGLQRWDVGDPRWAQLEQAAVERRDAHVMVRVDEARQHRGTGRVHRVCIVTRCGGNLLPCSDGDDGRVAVGNRLGIALAPLRTHRSHTGADDHCRPVHHQASYTRARLKPGQARCQRLSAELRSILKIGHRGPHALRQKTPRQADALRSERDRRRLTAPCRAVTKRSRMDPV
jgi:hypothetical protein